MSESQNSATSDKDRAPGPLAPKHNAQRWPKCATTAPSVVGGVVGLVVLVGVVLVVARGQQMY